MTADLPRLFDDLEAWGAEPKQALTDTFMADVAFFESCLIKFATEPFLQILRDSLVPEKKEEAIRAVHTMKGNADSLGLFPVMDAAMKVLGDLRADNLAQARADLPNLEHVFAQFCALLNAYTEHAQA